MPSESTRSWTASDAHEFSFGAGRGDRTPTLLTEPGILSPVRLPVSPSRLNHVASRGATFETDAERAGVMPSTLRIEHYALPGAARRRERRGDALMHDPAAPSR
jgi:hypothetical protein